ncbi:leucine-rich repeat receptor-like protein kinase PXL1 isoform X3 [Triticum aestivum]|uniref:leucine-rich repeat receptor-like protein kinase PXL1 isoform X3 n=1 Tax=Triticum aestivum TaxID=4565 RepID=UPI001D00524C|nr:leucine-rich repeat receptor-like protein kinase PXL1 isoform X3 [Triticum aestivum]
MSCCSHKSDSRCSHKVSSSLPQSLKEDPQLFQKAQTFFRFSDLCHGCQLLAFKLKTGVQRCIHLYLSYLKYVCRLSTFEANLFLCGLLKMAGSRLLWRTNHPVAMLPIVLNDQGIVDSLTENNQRSMWASTRIGEDEQLYLVHVQGTAGIGLPITLAVKKFQNSDGIVDGNLENRCKSEMILLASIRHDNIVNVLHFIQRENALLLVYTYQVNGSLDQWLHRREEGDLPLSWPQRKAIAIGVAQGLRHLHHGCNRPIVHHNITSTNILLDHNFKAVIASFGAAQMNMAGLNQPLPIAWTVFGNFGYAAPEYGRAASQLTEKVDTYSLGVVLLELVTGRVADGVDGQLAIWARDNCSELMAKKLERFKIAVDKGIPDQAQYMEEMATVFRLGVDCTVDDPQQRPSMQMAFKRLRRGRGLGRFGGLLTCYNLYITSEDVTQVKKV